MGSVRSALDEEISRFILKQSMFFVATAPLRASGHINLSPKGLDTFRILSPTTVAYLDLTGSGVETIAHLKENHRIVLMFCAFDGSPKIVRLHGSGTVIEPGHCEFARLRLQFPNYEGLRSIIMVEISRVSDSCGYAVPLMKFERHRDQLTAWVRKKGRDSLVSYREKNNRTSIDGLPGLEL